MKVKRNASVALSTIMVAGLAGLAGLVSAAPALASGFYTDAPARDIDMCVAEVRERADFTGASRVRYDVVATQRRHVGFAIEIRTTVYAPNAGAVLREYETVCVATGGREPSRFRMTEKG